MNKRDFLKSAGLGSLALLQPSLPAAARRPVPVQQKAGGHRVWIIPNAGDSVAELQRHFNAFRKAGITDVMIEADSEKHFKAARDAGLKAHRWMWIMNHTDKALLNSHPEWYSKNRKGESCATHPPYVAYYRWLCPSRTEVVNFLKDQVNSSLEKSYVDGIHLDYIRYCDVILPVNLWQKYGIDQSKELPEYDFCYCDTCRSQYKALKGKDPLELQHPDQSPSWRRFRYGRITNVVSNLAQVAKQHGKPISAAVFPTPEIARRIVRQDWANWPLDAVCPMIYHGFYKEDVSWIGEAAAEGVQTLHGSFPLYAGLFLPDFNGNMNELRKGVQLAVQNGAAGVSLFGKVTPAVLECLSA